ncbi:DNA internalization-related competence protein ComEC/Rec2 [Thiobacillus denitrificans ATCC 25259]|uniref:DNA internalization-related competence protein ComEC/Rec2 n=1 Tax=Thiobacillus denitrificans (strain ATCC 25259 / T1) TaxID=292415 RepID=Q3SI21_THIDA|nr:DNA internalization-related competence protein ComEC/Rec2 [Thiobacillus denitrificans]AAZ97712.1 DNA internalization-related competence protein ComEC/Rec2 [Thiobacillus denitrificans ATCC 25259]
MRAYLLAFCLGIGWLQQQAELPPTSWLWLLPLLSTVLLLPRFSAGPAALLRRAAITLLCAALGVAWATWRAELRLAERLPDHWQGVDIELVGVIAALPHADARGERFVLDVEKVLTPGVPTMPRVQLARYWPRDGVREVRMRAGERWHLTVRLKIPHGTHNLHGFDLEAWMLEQGIAASGYVREKPVPRRLAAQAATARGRIAAARADIRSRIFTRLEDGPYAGVIAALVVGDQRSIPHAQWRAFTRTGVNHLLSISGLHVTMIAALAGWFVATAWRRLPRAAERIAARQAGLIAAVLAAFGYSLLAGFQVPAQRTLFTLAVLALAFWGRREPRPFSALLWALLIVLLIDPWAVVSAGFWLSFGAMAAILWVSFGRVARPAKLRGWISVQAAVTLALAPALLLLFQQVSLVSPFANAVAIPVVSWLVTPLALLGVIVPPLWDAAAAVMEWLGSGLAWASNLSWAVMVRPAPQPWTAALALAGTFWLLLPRGFPARALGGLFFLPLAFSPVETLAPGGFRADVIDVGQGTAILIRTARHALLYDTGAAFADSDAGERIVVPYLRAIGVGELSGLIVSHDDNDHSGGLRSVLRDLRTGWLLHGLPADSPLLRGAPEPRRCARGQRWSWDGVRFAILNPSRAAYEGGKRSDNDFSCVLRVSAGTQSLLITGDAERRGELELLESGQDIGATVLVAGHHGSRTSSIAEFVDRVHPEHVVFTVGHRNRFGHPHPEVVGRFREAGSQVLRSDRAGLVRLTFGQAGVTASEYRPAHRRYWHAPPS